MDGKSTDSDETKNPQEDSLVNDIKKETFLAKLRACPGFGIVCALTSALFFSLCALFVKLVKDIHPIQLSLSRDAGQFLILLPLLFYKRDKVDICGPSGFRILLWVRGLIGSTSTIFFYMSVGLLTVANAVTISFLSMIIIPFIARIFLKESLTVPDLVFAIVSLCGVVLIIQPTFLFPLPEGQQPTTDAIGVLYSFIAAFLQAATIVLVRKIGRDTYPPLHVLYYSICGPVTTSIMLLSLQEFRFPCLSDIPWVFSLGVFGICGQLFVTIALQSERAGTVGVLRSTQIIFVYIFQIVVLGNIPSIMTLAGTILVLSTSVGIGIRKILNEGKKKN